MKEINNNYYVDDSNFNEEKFKDILNYDHLKCDFYEVNIVKETHNKIEVERRVCALYKDCFNSNELKEVYKDIEDLHQIDEDIQSLKYHLKKLHDKQSKILRGNLRKNIPNR